MPFFSPFGGSSNPNNSGGTIGGVVSGTAGAVTDLFAGFGDEAKAQGDLAEQQRYDLAATYAGQEEQFTAQSTAIKQSQQNREVTMAMGRTASQVAGAGFANSGSALDILRGNAQQGALQSAVLGQQGLITEQGYTEQQQSYESMASAAGAAASASKEAAFGGFIASGVQAAGAIASVAAL